jgi:hypothetical protein
MPAKPALPDDLTTRGWVWHPLIDSALVQYPDDPRKRTVLDAGSSEASIAAALRRIPRRGRPPKKAR